MIDEKLKCPECDYPIESGGATGNMYICPSCKAVFDFGEPLEKKEKPKRVVN